MKTQFTRVMTATVFLLITVASGFSAAVEFRFESPAMPSAPKIVNVVNSAAITGNQYFTVYANIQGQTQRERCCNGVCAHECEPNCDFSACGTTDFGGVADPRVTPNPPCIPGSADSSGGTNSSICGGKSGNPKLYYYFNADTTTTDSVNMTYDALTGNFKGNIPIDLYSSGDFVTYYIAAADNSGNVVSEVPEPSIAPCSAATSWDGGYDTPPLANCSFANNYEQCGYFKAGTPSCGSEYTVNDRAGDTCDANRTLSAKASVDILGMTAGFGKGFSELPTDNVVCAKVKFSGNPPDIGDNSTPIDAYQLMIFNPDIIDTNPDDLYMPNVTAVTYSPGISCADPYQVKVLWNGACVTNPNTTDPLSCKLITGDSNESRLKISVSNGFMTFIAKDAIPGGRTIVGGNSKSATIVMSTGNIQLDGGTPFWATDMTTGLSMIAKSRTVPLGGDQFPPAPPILPKDSTCLNGEGKSFTNGVCGQSASQPASNKCRMTINPSPDIADKYTIYHSVTNSASTATFLADITTNLTSQNIYDDTITTLDGKTHHYFFSATKNGLETPHNDWAKIGGCRVEDWVPPTNAMSVMCQTPPGKSSACNCAWDQDTNSDPSIRGFRILRGATQIADENTILAASGVTSYSRTDDGDLVNGAQYTYTIKSVDAGGNVSSGVSAVCIPEDLEAPAKVDSASLSLVMGARVGVKAMWNGGTESDIAEYNIYKCNNANYLCDTFPSNNWIKMNDLPVAHTGTDIHSFTDPDVRDGETAENEWCFWVEACDKCDETGSCPSTNAPNCSSFVTIRPYMQCLGVNVFYGDGPPPAAPTNVAVTAPASGETCSLTWSKVTSRSDGTPFADPNYPSPIELSTYYIMRAPLGETVPNNPNTAPSANIAGIASPFSPPKFVDTGLTNGATYQYLVIAYNGAQMYSAPQSSPVTCTPDDTTDPVSVSTVTATVGEGEASCDISWNAVADQNELTYSVHRCDKAASSCTKATSVDFPTAWGAELGLPITGITAPLSLSDTNVDLMSNNYTYCVTAKDPSGNEPPIFTGANAGQSDNCVECKIIIEFTSEPPTGVYATRYSSDSSYNRGAKIKYTNSPSFAENGGAGSHTIYICSSGSSSSCTKILASGLTTDQTSTSKDFVDLNASHAVAQGTYYFAVSYTNPQGVESAKTMSTGYVTLIWGDPPPCDMLSPPAYCNLTIKIGKITERKIMACTLAADPTGCKSDAYKIAEAAPQGAVVKVIDATTGLTVKSAYPATTGAVADMKVDPVSSWYVAGRQYKVVVEIPAESYSGLYGACQNASTVATDGICSILIKGPTSFSVSSPLTTDPYVISKARAVTGDALGSLFVGYGGDIGDVTGDGKVNIVDMMDIKFAYGKTKASGSQCYKTWADANLDGAVTVSDLMIIKKYYNKTMVVPKANGETITPALLKSADPMPACCKTSPPTCQ